MKKFKDMKVSRKMIGAFSIIILLFAANLFLSMLSIYMVSKNNTEFYNEQFKVVQSTQEFMTNLQGYGKSISRMAVASKGADGADIAQEVSKNSADADAYYAKMTECISQMDTYTSIDKAVFQEIKDSMTTLSESAKWMSNAFSRGSTMEGLAIFDSTYLKNATMVSTRVQTMIQEAQVQAEKAHAESNRLEHLLYIVSGVIAVVLVLFVVLICVSLINNITKPLEELEACSRAMAGGNLQFSVQYQSKDELGVLAGAFRNTRDSLQKYIKALEECMGAMGSGKLNFQTDVEFAGDFQAIKDSVDQIAAGLTHTMNLINTSTEQVMKGSEQIAQSGQELSQATLEQASSVEELAATINNISDRVQENAEHAIVASRMSDETAREVAAGSSQMKEMSRSMDDMKALAEQITGIIKDIEDIAFQTNILSLNAAVEAARAGEAGKGFSVVANEIRRLAAKTTEASKSTGELIGRTARLMKDEAQSAQQASEKLAAISDKAKETAETVNIISRVSNEQADAIVQIRQSIDMISDVVQQNSATAEETAASSEELSGQMQILKELVDTFEYDRE